MTQGLVFLAFICVIVLGGYLKWVYYYRRLKPYNECSDDEKRIRRVLAVICGVCAFVSIIIAVLRSR